MILESPGQPTYAPSCHLHDICGAPLQLSLKEAAARIGQTPRQIRYMIRNNRLPAVKIAGRWLIREADLPVSPEHDKRRAARAQELQVAVDEALRPHVRTVPTYTVRSVRAFTAAVASCRMAEAIPAPPLISERLQICVCALSRGAHAFHRREKTAAWSEARRAAADAVALLYLEGQPTADAVAEHIEAEVLPALAGLLRRQERSGGR